jgi:phage terminase large subunit-like protein
MRSKPTEDAPYPPEILAIRKMPYGLRGFRRFAKLLGMRIWPFQAYLLGFYFAGVTELVILIPKKNGKTTLLAALALYHLLMTPNAEAVIGASSREQAALLHKQATKLIEGAGLERRALPGDRREPTRYAGVFEVREGMHVIRFETGRLRVMPHEVRTADGVIPTLALVDELHRHPTGELYRVYRNGLLNGAQMITISTAGTSLDSPLGKLLEKAREYRLEQEGHRRTYTSPSGGFVLVEHALTGEDNLDDISLVYRVNPAPWLTKKLLRERHPDNSPMESPGSWARLTCNVWTEGDEPAILGPEWDRLYSDIGQVKEGDEVILAPSVGHNAAIGIASMRDGERVAIKAEVLEPTPGRSILATTEDRIVELCDLYRVVEVQHPVGAFIRSADLLKGRGVPMVEAPHSPARLTAASGTFDRLRRSGLLIHDGDPVLRKHVLAALLKVSEQGERYIIADRSRATIAVMMAAHAATAYSPDLYVGSPTAVG